MTSGTKEEMVAAFPAPFGLTARVCLLAALILAACGGSGGADAGGPVPRPEPGPTPIEEPAQTPAPTPAPAPWSAPPLDPNTLPSPYLDAWSEAENREWCALLAFEDLAHRSAVDAEARTAYFGGGWGVSYDLPELRSAFGVAGTGVEPGPNTYDDWPYRQVWQDGSTAGYGPEGGSGPNQLAYLRLEGQDCLYNVWSRLGRAHLEELLRELRYVATPQQGNER